MIVRLSHSQSARGPVKLEHAADARTRTGFAWLLSGSVATVQIACAAVTAMLIDRDRMGHVYGPVVHGVLATAAGALALGWARPTPVAVRPHEYRAARRCLWRPRFVRFVARDVPAPDGSVAAADGDLA